MAGGGGGGGRRGRGARLRLLGVGLWGGGKLLAGRKPIS